MQKSENNFNWGIWLISKPHPNVPRKCGTGCIVLHLVALNAADIGLAYLIGTVMFLAAFRSDF
jgi:hypothetical protein